jgi:hypothetical protein
MPGMADGKENYNKHAEYIRHLSTLVKGDAARQELLTIAASYEALANRLHHVVPAVADTAPIPDTPGE